MKCAIQGMTLQSQSILTEWYNLRTSSVPPRVMSSDRFPSRVFTVECVIAFMKSDFL